MKNILLIGFGSEIGSMLIYLNNPKKDNCYLDFGYAVHDQKFGLTNYKR